jgi:hypothetical protein
MPEIQVSVSELFDKVSILAIKKEKGLDVETELDKLNPTFVGYGNEITYRLFSLLKHINGLLWTIEDEKRTHEKEQNFDIKFQELSRLVYLLNDERARVKRLIDNVCGSEITEKKSHDGI